MAMAVHVSGRRTQPSHHRRMQDAPDTVHSDRVLGFFPSYATPALSSGHPIHQYHHPYPYAIVSPASFTPDTPDLDQSPSLCYRHDSPPNFRRPLSMSVLNDPAFSSDPRVHPHFPLTHASFYKELPSKSPVILVSELSHTPPVIPFDLSPHQEDPTFISHSPGSENRPSSPTTSSTCVSLDSDTHAGLPASTSLAETSAVIRSRSSVHPKASRVLPSDPPLPSSSRSASQCRDPVSSLLTMSSPAFDRPGPKRSASSPEQRVKAVKPPTVRFQTTPVHTDGSNRPEGKRRMKNFMRRLTGSRALDRIEENEEATSGRYQIDPFEAVGSNFAQLGPAYMYNDVEILRGDWHSKSKCKDIPGSVQDKKPAKIPHIETNGKFQNVVPGQIFHHPATTSGIISSPADITPPNITNNFSHKPGAGQTRPRNPHSSRYHSINPPEGAPPSQTVHAPVGHSSPTLFGGDMPQYPQDNFSPYHLHQMQTAPDLPPHYNEQHPEPLLLPRRDVNQEAIPSLPIVEPQGINLAPDFPRHRSTRSLDSSRTHATRTTHRTQNNLQPPRHHHLPKRLVMPAPLQPQPQQQEPVYPRGHSYDRHVDNDPFPPPDRHTHDPQAMFNQGRKLLRKKMAGFPGDVPLPTHAPAHTEVIYPLAKQPFTNVKNLKEGDRRRKLSKRKHDV